MANTLGYLLALSALLFVSGCCGSTESKSSCQLGTYGEACTQFCDRSAGTQFDLGPNCFSQCMDDVKQQGLGDATTCCKKSMRNECQDWCSAKLSQTAATYGSTMDQAEKDDFVQGCMDECTGGYQQLGISLDSCSLLSVGSFTN